MILLSLLFIYLFIYLLSFIYLFISFIYLFISFIYLLISFNLFAKLYLILAINVKEIVCQKSLYKTPISRKSLTDVNLVMKFIYLLFVYFIGKRRTRHTWTSKFQLGSSSPLLYKCFLTK